MGISIKIADIDRTEFIDARSLKIIDELTSRVNSASFDFACNDVALAPIDGQTILIEDGATKLFSGRVLSKDERFLPPALLGYKVECVDHTRDLDRRLVFESYVDQKGGDIIKDIIDKYIKTGIPTGYNDPDDKWTDEIKAYDNNFGTAAYDDIPPLSWGHFLELKIDAILCGSVRFYAWYKETVIDSIWLEVYYDGDWHKVYEGIFDDKIWVTKTFGVSHYVTKARVKFHNNFVAPSGCCLYEFNFIASAPGFTTNNVADGPTISEIAFDYVQVSEAITRITEMCGYEWYVDYDKDVHFFALNTYEAPFSLDDSQTNYKDLVINNDISQLRNRIYVKSSGLKDIFGEVFIGDGITDHWVCKFRTEIMLPTALDIDTLRWYGNAAEFSHNDIYLAVGLDWVLGMPQCPDIRIYKRDGDTFTKIGDPDTLPTGNAYGVGWSSDDIYLAVGHQVTPYITIYKRDDDVFTKLDNPAILPAGHGNGLSFGYNDTYLAISHTTTPYITIYKRAGDVFTKLNDPTNLPTGDGSGASFSPNGIYLAVCHTTTPFITIYKRTNDTFTKLNNPANLPTGNAHDVAFSPDGVYLAVGHTTTPYITIYKRDGDTFTKLANPEDLPTGTATGVAFAPNSTHLAVAHNTTPFFTLYKRGGDTFVKVDDPSPLPTGDGLSVAFSYNNNYIAIGHKVSPRLTIYKHFVPLIKVDGVYKTVGWVGIDNPDYYDFMLESDTKVLSLGTSTPTPADGVELFIIYTTLGVPICFRRDDKASIIDRQEKEGGDGVIEFCIVDNNIGSLAWANEAAKADLFRNAYPTIEATFITNRDDIRSGQIITLDSTKRGIIPPQQFIVQKVELMRVDTDEETIYVYQVTIANKFKKLEDLFIYLLNKSDVSLAGGAAAPGGGAAPSGVGVSTFLGLSDTPGNYNGSAGKYAKVNADANALEFAVPTIENNVIKIGEFPAGYNVIINNASGIIQQGTNTNDEIADAVTRRHTQNADTQLDFYNALFSDHTWSGERDMQLVGENVVFGQLLYFDWTVKRWRLAKANGNATMPGLRIALESKADGQACLMLVKGYIRDDSAFEFAGAMVYVSAATAGAMTSTAPSVATNQVQRVGVAKSADILFFDPSIDVGTI